MCPDNHREPHSVVSLRLSVIFEGCFLIQAPLNPREELKGRIGGKKELGEELGVKNWVGPS